MKIGDKNFLIQKGPSLDFSIRTEANFQIELRGLGATGHTSSLDAKASSK